MTRNIDELSNLTTKRAVEPKKYFEEMDLTEEQVKKRVEYTEKAYDIYDLILIMILTMADSESINFKLARGMLERQLQSLINEYTTADDYLIDYASDMAFDFIDTTAKHISKEWYTSSDRALFNAENGANDVLNYVEYKEAIESGKTHKKWITERDNRVRKTHKEVSNKVIPIKDFFRVGLARMRFPKDYEYAGVFPEEIVGCRCTIEYLGGNSLYRREKNTGEFSVLEEPMTLKHVHSVLNDMGDSIISVKYRIERNPEMLNVDYAGYTDDNGKFITLFPKAFQNREQLVKTLGHEQIHLQQILKSGKVKTTEELLMREKEAEISENKWWSEYVKRTGYRQKHNEVDTGI